MTTLQETTTALSPGSKEELLEKVRRLKAELPFLQEDIDIVQSGFSEFDPSEEDMLLGRRLRLNNELLKARRALADITRPNDLKTAKRNARLLIEAAKAFGTDGISGDTHATYMHRVAAISCWAPEWFENDPLGIRTEAFRVMPSPDNEYNTDHVIEYAERTGAKLIAMIEAGPQ